MSKGSDAEDVFVRREDFDRYFSRPIPKATFFRWVTEGKILKARLLDGWYPLNANLVRNGLPPVDISQFRTERQTVEKGLRNRQLLYLAAKAAYSGYGELMVPKFSVPAVLTERDAAIVETLIAAIDQGAWFVKDEPFEHSAYAIGFLEALERMNYLDSLENQDAV